MIDSRILTGVRNGVCAVGCLESPLDDYTKHLEIAGQFQVVGTGFLVQTGIVMTNRHVLEGLGSEQSRDGRHIPDTQRFLLFVVPTQDGTKLAITPRQIRHTYALRNSHVDVAFIRFEVVHPQHFQDIRPLNFGDLSQLRVSEKIAVFGYPHGNILLEKHSQVSRWGPVLQQGWVSAVSPYEGIGVPDELLLDVRGAEGISGSPVFQPATGNVCGMLHSGTVEAVTTTVFALPVSERLLAEWLAEYELELSQAEDHV